MRTRAWVRLARGAQLPRCSARRGRPPDRHQLPGTAPSLQASVYTDLKPAGGMSISSRGPRFLTRILEPAGRRAAIAASGPLLKKASAAPPRLLRTAWGGGTMGRGIRLTLFAL